MNASIKTAAILVIGNEILSGRTKDANIGWLAEQLTRLNIQTREVRIVPDIEAEIIASAHALRDKFDYVFTTGGIGPTHDDITADSIAKAFDVGIDHHPDAVQLLTNYYTDKTLLNDARLRMARIPDTASLIDNPVSAAPGFRIGNLFVMAGVPRIMQAMFKSIEHDLVGGAPLHMEVIDTFAREGDIADKLRLVAEQHPELDIGSYPFFRDGKVGTCLIVRGSDETQINKAADEIRLFI